MLNGNLMVRFALATALTIALAGSASAQYNLDMTGGQWYQNRGPLVDIPVRGGPSLADCALMGVPNSAPQGCLAGFRPVNGGIPQTSFAKVTVTAAGSTASAPANFTVPPAVFTQNDPRSTTHVSIIPTVVQLDTHFSLTGPGTVATFNPNPVTQTTQFGGTFPLQLGDRRLRKDAWATQAGRAGRDFSWCPVVGGGANGATNACLTPNPAANGALVAQPGAGNVNGRVVYSNPTGNGFGGTMNMLLGTQTNSGGVWVVLPFTVGMQPVILQNILSGMGRQHPGGHYATVDVDLLMSGPAWVGFMTAGQTALQSGQLVGPMNQPITTLGGVTPASAALGMGAMAGSFGADTNTNWGFPWTTGMVLGSNQDGTPTTLSLTGTDSRTRAGAGQITLVAGGASHRINSGNNFTPLDIVTFTLPEPSSSVMLGASLALIFGLYRVSRRK